MLSYLFFFQIYTYKIRTIRNLAHKKVVQYFYAFLLMCMHVLKLMETTRSEDLTYIFVLNSNQVMKV